MVDIEKETKEMMKGLRDSWEDDELFFKFFPNYHKDQTLGE